MESSPVTSLEWFITREGQIFPGCMDCCELTSSPLAHLAAGAEKMVDEDLALHLPDSTLPVFRSVVNDFHGRGHAFEPTPASMPKRKRQRTALATTVEATGDLL